jgi:hypothetical protein
MDKVLQFSKAFFIQSRQKLYEMYVLVVQLHTDNFFGTEEGR